MIDNVATLTTGVKGAEVSQIKKPSVVMYRGLGLARYSPDSLGREGASKASLARFFSKPERPHYPELACRGVAQTDNSDLSGFMIARRTGGPSPPHMERYKGSIFTIHHPKTVSTPLEVSRPEAAEAVPVAGRLLTGSTPQNGLRSSAPRTQ